MPAKKTAKKAQTVPLKDRAVAAALSIAAQQGWAEVTFSAIAKKCRCSLVDLNEIFEDKTDILAAYGRQVDRAVLQKTSADLESSERDRLFDIMMERFDVLNENRAALQSILKSFCVDPKQAVMGFPHLGKSMVWMMEGAGIPCTGVPGVMRAAGLMGVYLYTLKTWVQDDSTDMAKTMAALDKALGRAEQVAGLFFKDT